MKSARPLPTPSIPDRPGWIHHRLSRWIGLAIALLTTAIGLLSLLYPFLMPYLVEKASQAQARAGEMPLMISLLLGLCLATLVYEVQGQAVDTKLIALIGVLVGINAVLRFIEVGIPGPGGFSPVFLLIVLVGYVFGGRAGFLMGAMTFFVSALVTGGVGPWLPGQMITAGWVGMSAALLRTVVHLAGWREQRGEVFFLAAFSFAWGYLYGLVMNLWTWPFISGPAGQYWSQGVGLAETLQRYASYYLVTSFAWDTAMAVGNAVLLLAFGAAGLRALRRFRRKFSFAYLPIPPDARTERVT
jgi:energy-coupling factor transport system substrate-specific component